jgi:hypothetical protein
MWPGAPAGAVGARRAAFSATSIGASSRSGVEVALHGDAVADALPRVHRGVRQSTPITVPPASRWSSSSVAVPVPKWITGTPVAVSTS